MAEEIGSGLYIDSTLNKDDNNDIIYDTKYLVKQLNKYSTFNDDELNYMISLPFKYPQLNNICYIDYAGSSMYSSILLEKCNELWKNNLFTNIHSSIYSDTNRRVEECREHILSYFNTSLKYYNIIFTSGTTAALKLLSLSFNWSKNSEYSYTLDNHTSVVGLREIAKEKNSNITVIDPNENIIYTDVNTSDSIDDNTCNLFAFPAESNFSGTLYNLDMINIAKSGAYSARKVKKGKWFVLLDAAKYVTTNRLDLSIRSPDFVTISFYKMFGFPTGIGALLVKKDINLTEKYFAGGTVLGVSSTKPFHLSRALPYSLEEGTINFTQIPAISIGLNLMPSMSFINNYTKKLWKRLFGFMSNLKYSNGRYLVVILGSHNLDYNEDNIPKVLENLINRKNFDDDRTGPTLTFLLQDEDGNIMDSNELETLATSYKQPIYLRVGCFCNPGACSWYLNRNEEEYISSVGNGIVSCWNSRGKKFLNAIRLSIGIASSNIDVENWIQFFTNFYYKPLTNKASKSIIHIPIATKSLTLTSIFVYPIKSCGGFKVDNWKVGNRGLLYDREWAIADYNGSILNAKKHPNLVKIKTSIDLESSILQIGCDNNEIYILSLNEFPPESQIINLCSDSTTALFYDHPVNEWLSSFLNVKCRLIRLQHAVNRQSRAMKNQLSESENNKLQDFDILSFANEGQYLLIYESSLKLLHDYIGSLGGVDFDLVDQFRPNLVVKSINHTILDAFAEENWATLTNKINSISLFSLGSCPRCPVININQNDGSKVSLLTTLTDIRRRNALKGINFGILLYMKPHFVTIDNYLNCGDVFDIN